jgi:hypothetical protein
MFGFAGVSKLLGLPGLLGVPGMRDVESLAFNYRSRQVRWSCAQYFRDWKGSKSVTGQYAIHISGLRDEVQGLASIWKRNGSSSYEA